MEIFAYLTEWERMVAEYGKRGTGFYLGGFCDDGEAWISEPSTDWIDSAQHCMSVGSSFGSIQPQVPSRIARPFEKFLMAFVICNFKTDFKAPCDLYGSDVVYATLSPRTVAEYLTLYQQLAFQELKPIYQAGLPEIDPDLVSYDEFVEYLAMWGDTLQEAAAMQRGIICCCG